MPEITVDGVRLAYDSHGDGPPVLLLGGTGMPKEAWLRAWVPAMVDAGYRAVTVDTRGIGGSAAPPAPYALADLVADTAGLVEGLGIAPAAVVGYSLGGMIAEELAATRPELVRAAVLLSAARPASAYARLAGQATAEMEATGVELPAAAAAVQLLGQLLTAEQLQDDALVEIMYGRLAALPPWRGPGRLGQYTAGMDAELDDGYRQRRPHVERPVLVVAFAQDTHLPPRSAAAMVAAVPGAELVVVEGAGHGGALTHAAEVTKHVLEFLARH